MGNKKLKICNAYCGIGGNRKLWGDDYEITVIENNKEIAAVYKKFFPNDEVLITDAHDFLLEFYKDFDFIWSSPPCQSHSSFRQNICVRYRGTKPVYPDLKLYEEILFLQANFKGKWVVENVKPYYKPLIEPTSKLDRHLFWSNFEIKDKTFKKDNIRKIQIPGLQKKYGFNLDNFRIKNKRQVLRNCVEPEMGKYILDCALGKIKQQTLL